MKSISIRELHAKTGHWVRKAASVGAIEITDDGKPVAQIVSAPPVREVPFFARRVDTPALRRLMASGKLKGGTDSTTIISEDREDRYE